MAELDWRIRVDQMKIEAETWRNLAEEWEKHPPTDPAYFARCMAEAHDRIAHEIEVAYLPF